jgi:tRNA-guanine family transglycosylase
LLHLPEFQPVIYSPSHLGSRNAGFHLISIHNLHTLIRLVTLCRQAILEQRFSAFAQEFLTQYNHPKK